MIRVVILALACAQVCVARAETAANTNPAGCERVAEHGLCTTSLKKLPEEVAAHVRGMNDSCRQVNGEPLSGPTVEHGGLAAGLEFWAINEGSLQCKGAETLYSGSHGSDVAVYVSALDGHTKQAFNQGAYGMAIEHASNTSTIWITVAGRLCGQQGDPTNAELIFCERALWWDFKAKKLNFAPPSEARILHHSAGQATELTQGPIPVVLERPANSSPPLSFQPAVHNGSQMVVSEWKNGTIEIVYDVPRPGLSVKKGTLLFRGVKVGPRYSGNAYTFKTGCPPTPYPVFGVEDDRREIIVLNGTAPRRVGSSCDVVGSANTKLIFDVHIDGDE